jgi:hypothetical protein
MKRIAKIVMILAAAAALSGCLSLKPFTQDELRRISCAPVERVAQS